MEDTDEAYRKDNFGECLQHYLDKRFKNDENISAKKTIKILYSYRNELQSLKFQMVNIKKKMDMFYGLLEKKDHQYDDLKSQYILLLKAHSSLAEFTDKIVKQK